MNEKFGICQLAIMPLRAEPSGRSEMVSQLLFGECYTVTDANPGWLQVETAHDSYSGWIDQFQHTELEQGSWEIILRNSQFVSQLQAVAFSPEGIGEMQKKTVVLGSCFPFYENRWGDDFFRTDRLYKIDTPVAENVVRQIGEKLPFRDIRETALLYLNAPYLWGGRSPFGIDCSGLTQMVFRLCGYPLPRDSRQQAEQGISVHFSERQPGDLAFFKNQDGKVVHVGMVLEADEIIHASSRVRIDRLDEQGIWCVERSEYSHTFHSLRRILQANQAVDAGYQTGFEA
jgi:gamma-D-glutamyl-L-lysine dipeptidyl-peptidase